MSWHPVGETAREILKATICNAAMSGNYETLAALRRALESATDGPFERELSELLDQVVVEEEALS